MFVSKEKLEKLKQRILTAFDDVPYPEGLIAPHECDECYEIRKTFAGSDWKTIDPKVLEENFGIISLFSSQAFHYFLPAYLIYSLNRFSEKDNTTLEFTVYAITPGKEAVENRFDYWRERFEEFNSEQMSCIYEFLDFVRQDESHYSFIDDVIKGEKNLREFIKPDSAKSQKL